MALSGEAVLLSSALASTKLLHLSSKGKTAGNRQIIPGPSMRALSSSPYHHHHCDWVWVDCLAFVVARHRTPPTPSVRSISVDHRPATLRTLQTPLNHCLSLLNHHWTLLLSDSSFPPFCRSFSRIQKTNAWRSKKPRQQDTKVPTL